MKIEKWSIVTKSSPYTAPEMIVGRLHGAVYGHQRFHDGEIITTSPIMGNDGELIITKSLSKYELGVVDPEYDKLYPNARIRLFESLKGG